MPRLHDYVEHRLAERIKSGTVVVWYDPRREFATFVGEIRGGQRAASGVHDIRVEGAAAYLIEYGDSIFEVRAAAEPLAGLENPRPLLVYLAGVARDAKGSILMELEKAGDCYEPQLKKLARDLLRQTHTDGDIDALLASDAVTYEDIAKAAEGGAEGPPSILKGLFQEASGSEGLLAAWLASDSRDARAVEKEATGELARLIQSRLGLRVSVADPLPKIRRIVARYVLAGEFRDDLAAPPPASLDGVEAPHSKAEIVAIRDLAQRLRMSYPDAYCELADQIESELGLAKVSIPAGALGSIDTFRFEEEALRKHCEGLIATAKYDEALALVDEREHSFWLDREVSRRARWDSCRRMAQLGQLAASVKSAVTSFHGEAAAWVRAYSAADGWFLMDQAQRRLEELVSRLDDEPAERPLGLVRQAYSESTQLMAERFGKALAASGWSAGGVAHQTHTYRDDVGQRPKPVAYFLVDAMRFEMGAELAERLVSTAEVRLQPALGALPSITPIGMGALMPGASGSFDVVEEGGKLGVRIEGSFLPDLTARRKFVSSRVPALQDLALGELLMLSVAKLQAKVAGAEIVIVRSQEIDIAGESGLGYQARQIMDTLIDNLARAIRRLAAAGVQNAVVSADHGHLFSHADLDESMRVESPGGAQVELHRRCWIGRGGMTPPGCTRVAAAALGYQSDLDFVFPAGTAVFKAGGDLAYHHGGPSLQELVVPVLTVRSAPVASPAKTEVISVLNPPSVITNRIFSVEIQAGGQNLAMFASPTTVQPLLLAAGQQVGKAAMVVNAELDQAAGTVTLQPNAPATVGFILSDETVQSVRLVILDPLTDAELYRSATDIPVRFGVA